MAKHRRRTIGQSFNHMFLRGLGILLPSVLTVWILIAAFNFMKYKVAEPINAATRTAVLRFTQFPQVGSDELIEGREALTSQQRSAWRAAGDSEAWLVAHVRRTKLQQWWVRNSLWTDLIGLVVAAVAIYSAGVLVTSFIGARLYRRGERVLHQVPLIRSVYPSVKQVTEFLLGSQDKKFKFNRVVAVQYPRMGLWSIGLVTGEPLGLIQAHAGKPCLTVFIPSSPTPFTGYVITVPREDTIDLPVSIEEAIRFTVSGGVLVPPAHGEADREEVQTAGETEVQMAGQAASTGPTAPADASRRTMDA